VERQPAAPAAVVTDEEREAAAEAIHCGYINLENVAKLNPALARHPIYMMSRRQIAEGLKLLGRDVDE
jgi:hypothetical protein